LKLKEGRNPTEGFRDGERYSHVFCGLS
jgi:hypothetical protein